ncbi:AAA domain-containing protein [Calothrix sp. CCY 0018]|uniref:AAA domain-containing protein n=1 Tax=Calothrix sp. CCY 0018 TaxID=3103864 RepID=UPI0039C6E92C
MSNHHSKITKILNAWLDFFYLENLCQAQINAADDSKQIFDKGISIIGDNLSLHESTFKQLKQEYQLFVKKGKTNDFKIAVTFPSIWRVIDNSRRFYPLFAIDISAIFTGNYRAKGWDLISCSFQPIIPNLMEFYELDEEEAENLVTLEGLKVFLETTFKKPFHTLQDFVDLIEVPPKPFTTKRNPYLFQCSLGNWNYNLKKDLQKILDTQHYSWAQPGHPAYEYLFGKPNEPIHETLYSGAFPTHPPTDSQAAVLKHAQNNPLTAAFGPPGNAKTTITLHLIAQQVVKRAVHLAQTGEDISNLTLVTSTNNRAVTNVEERLSSITGTERFCLSGGSKELINQQLLPKLQAALDWLQQQGFDAIKLEEISAQLLAVENQIQNLQNQDQLYVQQQAADKKLLSQLNVDIQVLTEEIADQERGVSTDFSQLLGSNGDSHQLNLQLFKTDYSQYPFDAYLEIEPHLNNAIRALYCTKNGLNNGRNNNWWTRFQRWLVKLWRKLTKTTDRHILKRLYQQIEIPISATLATPFPFQMPLTRESLIAAKSALTEQLEAANQWREHSGNMSNALRRLEEMKTCKLQLEEKLASIPTQHNCTPSNTEHHHLQVQLFELSWQYLQLIALQRNSEVINSIKTYIAFLNGEWDAFRTIARDWRNIYRNLSLIFPVFTSTLHSIRNLFPYPDSGCIDRVIVDEAGMIPLHQAFPVLVRCNQALFVGDPMQLEPVMNLTQQTLEQYCNQAFNARGLTAEYYDLYSPTATNTATAYHRAAGASGKPGDMGQGIILKEHYRCVEPIISYCDRTCNYGMVVKTPDKPSLLGSNLIAYHVSGEYESHTNPAEVLAVETIVAQLLEAGYCINSPDNDKTIGIISPYRRQANALKSHLQSVWQDFSPGSIGTVHTFQGGEKSAIILSTRQCRPSDSLWFINRRPNLLNVAVSRAKELFILVGNLERLEQAGGYSKMLVEHINQHGELRNIAHPRHAA